MLSLDQRPLILTEAQEGVGWRCFLSSLLCNTSSIADDPDRQQLLIMGHLDRAGAAAQDTTGALH